MISLKFYIYDWLKVNHKFMRAGLSRCRRVSRRRSCCASIRGILAATEAFLATSLDSTVMPHRSSFYLHITPSESATGFISFDIKDNDGVSFIEVYYPL